MRPYLLLNEEFVMTDSLKLHCLATIIGSNGPNRPGSEPSLADIGIEQNEAEALIAQGYARWAEPSAAAASGADRELSDLKKDELLAIAKEMEITGAAGMTKPELIAAIEAERVEVPADAVEPPAAETTEPADEPAAAGEAADVPAGE